VIEPEIPDLAETRRWIARMINSLALAVGKTVRMNSLAATSSLLQPGRRRWLQVGTQDAVTGIERNQNRTCFDLK
jgi:hypothetical protein